MSSHLLLMSVGPVQDFISTARQCQDLWYGSHLLSRLSESAARCLQGSAPHVSHTLIFPAGLNADSDVDVNADSGASPRSVANKILLQLKDCSEADVKRVAREAREAIQKTLKEEVKVAFDKISSNNPHFMRDVAEQQVDVDELIEFVWASAPLESDARYAQTRAELEQTLAAVKASRAWRAPSWTQHPGVPKSSLDGVRESVIHEDAYDLMKKDATRGARQLRETFKVKRQERLCGVGLLKRLGADLDEAQTDRPSFHSTSHVAAGPMLCALQRLKPHAALNALQEVYSELQAGRRFRLRASSRPGGGAGAPGSFAELSPPTWMRSLLPEGAPTSLKVPRTLVWDQEGATPWRGLDGYLLFPSRAQDILEQSGVEPSRQLERRLERTQTDLLRSLGRSEPNSYYAVLLADGDRMGAALDAFNEIEAHKLLAEHLNSFADGCEALVEDQAGSLIYAGGDDVLALLPLHTALECAEGLYKAFDQAMARFEEAQTKRSALPQAYQRPTLSVGLAVVHHLESMGEALNIARESERAAKLSGRNALSIITSPRGGSTYEACSSWNTHPPRKEASAHAIDHLPLHQRLMRWAEWLHHGELPRGISHELIEAASLFDERRGAYTQALSLDEPFEAYVTNIINSKRTRGGGQEAGDAPVQAVSDYLTAQAKVYGRVEAAERLGHELEIARLFLHAHQLAWLTTPSKTPSAELSSEVTR